MKLKAQIILIFIFTTATVIAVTGYLYYNNVRNILIDQNINELKAVSQAKAARVNALIQNRVIEHEILRRSSVIRSDLYRYVSELDTNGINKISLYNSIIRSKEAIEGINRLMILDSAGNVVISSSPAKTRKENFSDYTSVSKFADKSKVNIEYRYNEHEELTLCLAGFIDNDYILLIENDVTSITSVTEEYTGLRNTGETAIFYIDEEGNIIYLTPLRAYNKAFLKEVKNPDIQNFQDGIKRGTVVYQNILDYRNKRVIATVNNISRTNWKIMTKIDVNEALASMDELRKMTFMATGLITLIMLLLIYLFAYFFVQPINDMAAVAEEISLGDLTKRVEIKSKNELGHLASSFNKMTNSLVASQKELQGKINELNRSNSALDKFAHVVSHDIKAPINSIEGYTNLMKLEFKNKLSPADMELVLKVHEQTKRTKEMIKDILQFAEVKAQKGGVSNQIDLNEVIDQLRITLAMPEHIKLYVTNRLPVVNIERILAIQIFQNLISNSVKYMDKAEGIIRINCITSMTMHTFSIADNGIGIEKDKQAKIFELFNVGDATKSYDSTGVGLSIIKNIIEECGGTIWVESTKGVGTTFYFTIPVSKPVV